MTIRHLLFAKSILSSLFNYVIKKNSITFAAFLVVSSAIIFNLLFNENFNVQAHNSEEKENSPQNEISEPNSNILANLNLVIRVAQDGLAPMNTTADMLNGRNICPANPTDGCDFSPTNSIVRTNDSVIYTYDYNVNAGDEDVTITAYAPIGTVWYFLPAFCNMPGSSLNNGNGINSQSIITCKRGMQTSGTAESLPFTAIVLGSTVNGTSLNAIGSISGPNSSTIFTGSLPVTVSAAPRFNLRKDNVNFSGDNTVGYTVNYTATIEVFDDSSPAELNPRYGSSILSSPITFTDDVSQISPNAQYVNGSCSGNSGTISCTQSSAGQPISMTITGANTSLSQYSIPPNDGRFIVGTYSFSIFVPASDVGAGLDITNVLTGFDPTSPTGQSNFSTGTENLADNSASRHIQPPGPPGNGTGFFRKNFVRDYNSDSVLAMDSFVAPAEIFAARVFFFNNTGATLNNVVLCDVMDNTKYNVIESSPGNVFGTGGQAPTLVEFASGYITSPPTAPGNLNDIRAECSDSVNWQPLTAFLPGNLASITKFRVHYDSMTNGASGIVRVRVQARDTDSNNQPIPTGSALVNVGAWRNSAIADFINNDYARLILARAIVRITKETENNNTANSIETGSAAGIGYVLRPTISSISPSGPLTPVPVTVTDVLPPGLFYVQNSSNTTLVLPIGQCTGVGAPHSACTVAGQQILTWNLNPNPTPNMPIPPITFRVTADLTVSNNQILTNTAVISSPADPSQESLRTATRSIIGASPSTFLIYKQTSTPQINVNGIFSYKVSYRNASFLTDFSGMDFIDILPFNGDATLPFGSNTHQRMPPTNFNVNGTRKLTGVSVTGATPIWYFTTAPASSINLSPKDPSNLIPGAGTNIWCPGTAQPNGTITGCAFNLDAVTAVRMRDTMTMPRNNTIRSFVLDFATDNNQANDIYTNNSGGSVAEIVLPVSSVNASVVVLEGSISGLVWFDTNGNGTRDASETGRVNNSTVTLLGTTAGNDPVNRTTTTNSSGAYKFNGLGSGIYTVKFTRPLNYKASPKNAGPDNSDSDGDPVTLITDVAGLGETTVDQGFFQLNLSGTVWADANNDGILFAENGIPSINLQLLDSSDNVVQITQTATNGNYSFVNLTAGDYRVVLNPKGISSSSVFFPNPNDNVDSDNNGMPQSGLIVSNPITLAAGTEPTINHVNGTTRNTTLDFGLVLVPTAASVALGGRVTTSDGQGVSKAIVTIANANGSVHSAITNPFGFYRFDDVPVGTTVIISVRSKSYTFEESTRVITVTEELNEINFVSNNK